MKLPSFPSAFFLGVAVTFASLRSQESSSPRPWSDYRTILWIGDTVWKRPEKLPLFFDRLHELGINTAMVPGGGDPKPFVERHFPYYVENIVNKGLCLKWSSKVTNWDAFVTAWHKSRDEQGLVRDSSLEDPAWLAWARGQMREAAERNKAHQPLAYDIRDELSVTSSANPFDYDFSPVSLASFRGWLRSRYASLEALNAQWETRFVSWDDVRPFTTDRIKNRLASGDALPRGKPDWQTVQRVRFDPLEARKTPTRWNFSPWADHRTYMDASLARTLQDLRAAAHEVDPQTPVGIEGTQMPHAFGGYDLWRLSQSIDWIEPYDIGSSREVLGSFMPRKTFLTTVFEKETEPALRRLWHLLLLGDRGAIVWWSEDVIDWKSENYTLTPKAMALAPALHELTSPLARLFLLAEREHDPIAIHYSQASIQVDWLIESCEDGSTWLRRFSSYEADHNRQARARKAFLKAFQDLGYSPVFISSEEIEEGRLKDFRVLALPTSLALSIGEARALEGLLAKPVGESTVLADGAPGLFDEHGRLREKGLLDEVFPPSAPWSRLYAARSGLQQQAESRDGDVAAFSKDRLKAAPLAGWAEWIAARLPKLSRDVEVIGAPAARVRVHRFLLGPARIVAFERNIDYQMSEDLKQAGGNQNLEVAFELEAHLSRPAHVYELRAERYLGRTDHISTQLDPWRPALFALLDEKLPGERVIERLLEAGGK